MTIRHQFVAYDEDHAKGIIKRVNKALGGGSRLGYVRPYVAPVFFLDLGDDNPDELYKEVWEVWPKASYALNVGTTHPDGHDIILGGTLLPPEEW